MPLAFADFRFVPGARLTPERFPSPEGVWHSLLPLPALPVTGFGGAVPSASGLGRFRPQLAETPQPLTFQEET